MLTRPQWRCIPCVKSENSFPRHQSYFWGVGGSVTLENLADLLAIPRLPPPFKLIIIRKH